jgi:hypothetical protein
VLQDFERYHYVRAPVAKRQLQDVRTNCWQPAGRGSATFVATSVSRHELTTRQAGDKRGEFAIARSHVDDESVTYRGARHRCPNQPLPAGPPRCCPLVTRVHARKLCRFNRRVDDRQSRVGAFTAAFHL